MAAHSADARGLVVTVAAVGALLFVISLLYGAWAYLWPFGIEARPTSASANRRAIAIDVLLFTAFAAHHSVFARLRLRDWVRRLTSSRLERSLYVWVASLLFLGLIASWQPVAGRLWATEGAVAIVLAIVQCAGLIVTLRAAAALDVFSLAGLRQALGDRPANPTVLMDSGLYRVVRHPVYFGWCLMVWATPTMTGTRFVFATVSTLYLVAAIPFEERSLRREFGEAYDRYARRVRWRMLWGLY